MTAINARKRQSNMTRSIIASTRFAPCSRGVAGNSDWSADGASNKCSRDATSSSRGRGNTLSYCDAKTLKLGTMCFFPCKLFLVRSDGCNFLASQNVLSAYLPEQEVLLVNALPPQDLEETVFRQWLKETIAVRHGLKNWECVLIFIPPTTPWKASMGDAKLAQQKLFVGTFFTEQIWCAWESDLSQHQNIKLFSYPNLRTKEKLSTRLQHFLLCYSAFANSSSFVNFHRLKVYFTSTISFHFLWNRRERDRGRETDRQTSIPCTRFPFSKEPTVFPLRLFFSQARALCITCNKSILYRKITNNIVEKSTNRCLGKESFCKSSFFS